jgi:hypothetical protein
MTRINSTRGTHSVRRSVLGWSVCAALALVVVAAVSCQPKQEQQQTGETTPPSGQNETLAAGCIPDPLAQTGTIDDSGKVTPGTIPLSKRAGDRVQWRNTAHDTMLIILKDSHVSLLVPPGQVTSSFRVCLACDNGNYPYVVKRMVLGSPENPAISRPPAEPQLGVGD